MKGSVEITVTTKLEISYPVLVALTVTVPAELHVKVPLDALEDEITAPSEVSKE